jgi:hypothetical protein
MTMYLLTSDTGYVSAHGETCRHVVLTIASSLRGRGEVVKLLRLRIGPDGVEQAEDVTEEMGKHDESCSAQT